VFLKSSYCENVCNAASVVSASRLVGLSRVMSVSPTIDLNDDEDDDVG